MTLCYAPPLDAAFAEEYLQHEVEASFGTWLLNPSTGELVHSGKVPVERPIGRNTTERAMIETAYKWAPLKVHRATFPRGVSGDRWRLKLSLTRRKEVLLETSQRAYVLVTLRGLEPELPVYVDGLHALRQRGWITTSIANKIHVHAQAS